MDRAIVFLMFAAPICLSSCSFEQHYVGAVLACDGGAAGNAEVEAWKNQWLPFHLPEHLGTVHTKPDGSFELETDERAGFFIFSGQQLVMQNHPKYSQSKCVVDAA